MLRLQVNTMLIPRRISEWLVFRRENFPGRLMPRGTKCPYQTLLHIPQMRLPTANEIVVKEEVETEKGGEG